MERWTGPDVRLRIAADEGGGIVDLRPSATDQDPKLRRLLLGRAAKLERLGLAEPVASCRSTLKPVIKQASRDLSIRGDMIKTMHRAMTSAGREADVSVFALHGDGAEDPALGRLIARGSHDELKGSVPGPRHSEPPCLYQPQTASTGI